MKTGGQGTVLCPEQSPQSSLTHLNPFRYRGYVFDDETGLYYLQSRYYDPVIGRFVNADVYCDTGTFTSLSTNMFAYCENNPINHIDVSGKKWDVNTLIKKGKQLVNSLVILLDLNGTKNKKYFIL